MDPFRFTADGVVSSAPASKASRTDHYYGFALSRSRFAYYGFALSRSRFAYYGFALSRSRFAYYGFALSRSRFAYYGFALSRSRFAYYGFALSRSRSAPSSARRGIGRIQVPSKRQRHRHWLRRSRAMCLFVANSYIACGMGSTGTARKTGFENAR